MRLRWLIVFAVLPLYAQTTSDRPAIRKQGTAAQLIVDGRPFLILGGELHNSSSSSLAYRERGNPLFIPETLGQGNGPRNFFYALGEHDAMGISPFAVDTIPNPKESDLARSYALIAQIAPLILEHQGKGEMTGFVLNKEKPSIVKNIGGHELEISLDTIFGSTAENGYGIVIATGPDEFIGAGSGFRVHFKPATPGPARAGIGSVDEGAIRNGKWISGRRLNGDENDQGGYWRFDRAALRIERCVVYRWE